ncbi:hypothetical protein ACFV2S_13880 [Streptomyces sp. NPDC059695]|uniref:hypothetical protein n=1 Tax=Streptomyces sp. NPDC059695 TaxID=3346910 RepID=UPI00369F650B
MRHHHLAAAVVVLALAGCSATGSDGAGGSAEPPVGAVPTMLRTTDVSFPLDAYEATLAQQSTLGRAQNVLIGRCMTRLGFAYQAPEPPAVPTTGANARVYGVTDPEAAARYGYANPQEPDAPARAAAAKPPTPAEELALGGRKDLKPGDLPATLEEAEKAGGSDGTLNGQKVPVGGCSRESFLRLYARRANEVDILFVFNLKSEAESKAREDSRIRAVDKSWSACMAQAGYTVRNPMRAPHELSLGDAELGGPRGITAAKADVRCKQRTNLVGVHYAVTTAYQRQLIEQNAETLSLAKEQVDSRLKLAAALTH